MQEPEAATPSSWRAASAALLVGGFGAGFLATVPRGGRLARALPALTAGVAFGASIPVALASRRPPITPETAALALAATTAPPAFSVVVAARDEAPVIGRLIGDLAHQDYRDEAGRPRIEVVVVDDRSVDGTGEAARRTAAEWGIEDLLRVVPRRGAGLSDGKGAALSAAPPESCRGDVVVVLDADARVEPGFLRRAAGYFAAGCIAVTARRRILDGDRGWLEGAQADEQTLDGEINRGRWAMGGCSEFRGNGIMIRRSVLAELGGWRAAALTEDTDLSSRLAAARGVGVVWALDVEVWEEPVSEVAALWSQRKRWAEGALRRFLEHTPAVLRSPQLSVRGKVDFGVYALQTVGAPVVLGAVAGSSIRGRKGVLAGVVGGYIGAGAVLAWDSLRWESGMAARQRLLRTLRVSMFNAVWLLAIPRALLALACRPGPIRYEKMEHRGLVEPEIHRPTASR